MLEHISYIIKVIRTKDIKTYEELEKDIEDCRKSLINFDTSYAQFVEEINAHIDIIKQVTKLTKSNILYCDKSSWTF